MIYLNKTVQLHAFVLLFSVAATARATAQQITFDVEHAKNIEINHGFRTSAESTIRSYNNQMLQDMESTNESLLRFTAAKELVYRSLVEVNNLLRDGKQAKTIALLLSRITQNTNRLMKTAGSDPLYLPFATRTMEYMTSQALGLVNEVQAVVVNPKILMEHRQRDHLLQNILFRLRMIAASLSRICNVVEYNKSKGFWKAVNPFQNYINRDKAIIQDIIRKAGYLKR